MQKLKKGEELFWLSYTNDMFTNTIPVNYGIDVRIHKGFFVKKRDSVIFVETLVNKDFIDNFKGIILGVKMLPVKKSQISKAEIGLGCRQTIYMSMEEAKLGVIKIILGGSEDE